MKKHGLKEIIVPGQDLTAYIASVNSIAILTPDQEREFAMQYYHDDNIAAAQQIIIAHLRFVVSISKMYSGYGLSREDLIQEGNVGLMKAVKGFNPEFGVRFVSFAIHWIKAEMHSYIIKNWRIVKIATTKAQRKLFFNLRSSKKQIGWLNAEESASIAQDLNVDTKIVQEMEGRLTVNDAAFDADDDESPANYLEDQSSDLAHNIEEAEWKKNTNDKLYKAIAELDERSRDILSSRWLGESKTTLHELANHYNVSAERIRQIEKNAMNKIKLTIRS